MFYPMQHLGFTLIECLLSLALLALLLTGATHSYRSFTDNNTVSHALADWANTLRFARVHALTTGKTVTICPGVSNACDEQNYAKGWFIFTENITGILAQYDPDERVLAVGMPLDAQIHFQTNITYPLHFHADGRTNGNGHFIICSQPEPNYAAGIVLIHSGRLRSAKTEELALCG